MQNVQNFVTLINQSGGFAGSVPDFVTGSWFGLFCLRSRSCSGSGSGSFYHLAKKSKKNLDSYYFVTLFDFLSLNNDVNVGSKSNKEGKIYLKIIFLLALWRSMTKIARSGSRDPLVRGMDPRIRIHHKMSWIRNTGYLIVNNWYFIK